MARTISTIYNSMIAEKETFSNLSSLLPTGETNPAQSLLTQLTSTSKVAIWRLIFFVCAVAIWIHENLWDNFLLDITNIANSAIPGTAQWYIKTVKAFQFGDQLIWDGDKFTYAVIDETKLVVDQCAIVLSTGVLYIKVAKLNSGILEPLSTSEETALKNYIEKIKFAGTQVSVINDTADLLQLAYTIYYDPLVIYYNSDDSGDALNGSLISDPSVFPVNDAIINYIQILDFNGIFQVSSLTDAIQAATGVKNVVANTVEAKYGMIAYADILAIESQTYQSNAGYLAIDPTYPLTSAITYIPYS